MTEVRQADGRPFGAEDASIGVPRDSGWVTWNTGVCSITGCSEAAAAAIERAHGPRRRAHWQPYCAAHARERGVEGVDGTLGWTAEFLAPPSRMAPRDEIVDGRTP